MTWWRVRGAGFWVEMDGRLHKPWCMNTTTLMEMLFDIERALQRTNYEAARTMVMEAEEFVMRSQRELILVQTEKLRRAA